MFSTVTQINHVYVITSGQAIQTLPAAHRLADLYVDRRRPDRELAGILIHEIVAP
jgi:hypothetical protein